MTRIFIHAGDHKTGTSAVQLALSRYQKKHKGGRAGPYFPHAGRGNRMAHHNLAWELRGKAARFRPERGGWKDLTAELSDVKPELSVISTEAFEGVDPRQLQQAVHRHLSALGDATLALYVRPHFFRVLSGYAQKVKTGQFTGTVGDFVETVIRNGGLIGFADRLSHWSDVFGPALKLRAFDRGTLVGGDIITDFFGHVLEIDAVALADIQAMAQAANVSPGATVLDIAARHARALALDDNRALAMRMEPFFLKRLRTELMGVYSDDVLPAMPVSHADRFFEAALPDAERLDRGVFADTPIFVDALVRGRQQAVAHLPDLQYRDAREIAIHDAYARLITAIVRKHLSRFPE